MSTITSSNLRTDEGAAIDSGARGRVGRLRFWFRALMGTVAVLLLFLGFALWIVTRSWFIAGRVAPVLEKKLGGTVVIGKASYRGGSSFRLENLRLSARGLQGEAAEVASVQYLDVKLNLQDLLRGSVSLSDVVVDGLVIRISEDANERNSFNVMQLKPVPEKPDGKPFIPPRVRISHAMLEYGSHAGALFKSFGQRLVSGEMYPSQLGDGWFNYELGEIDGAGVGLGGRGIFIKGRFNPITYAQESRIDGLQLDDKTKQSSPEIVREWWDLMKLEGKLDGVALTFAPGKPFVVEFAVENVGMTLPIANENLWARYQNGEIIPTTSQPRMHVKSGVIRLGTDSIVLDQLTGELVSSEGGPGLVGVPYKITLSIPDLPEIDWEQREAWMEQVLETAPFSLKFEIEDFSLQAADPAATPAIDLPVLVAKVLAKFSMTNWVLSSSVEVVRAAPTRDGSGELVASKPTTSGQAYIHKASGKYQKFAFQLDDVDAYIQFDNEKATLHYLEGKSSGEGRVRISGEIKPPENDASVSLKLIGTNMQLDERFRAALKEGELKAFDMLFNVPSYEAMRAAGFLPDQTAIDAAKQRQQSILDQISQLQIAASNGDTTASARIEALQSEQSKLQRSIDAGPFEMGGVVDVDLMIERPLGPKQTTTTTGTITVKKAGAVFDKFPYPLRAIGGVIEWKQDKVVLRPDVNGNGLPIVTPGGGLAHISGEIDFAKRDGKRKVRPNLIVKVVDDAMNDSILAAIPMSRDETQSLPAGQHWPGVLSKTARIIRGIGLDGSFQYEGTVNTGAEDRIEWDFAVRLDDGLARPNMELARALGQSGELWPSGITLDRVTGSIHVSRTEAQWKDIAGISGSTRVTTSGLFDFGEGTDNDYVEVAIDGIPLEKFVLNAISSDHRSKADAVWEHLQPTGIFDALVRFDENQSGPDGTIITITPTTFDLGLDGQRQTLVHRQGSVMFTRFGARFDELLLDLVAEDRRPDGSVTFNGQYAWANEGDGLDVAGHWEGGRFESPIIAEALRSFAAGGTYERFRALQPSGMFDADFILGPIGGGKDESLRYKFDVHPNSLAMHLNDIPVVADIVWGSVTIEPDQIRLGDLQGRHAGGEFSVGGTVSTASPVIADLVVGYHGRARSSQLEAFLPAVVREAMDSLKLQDGAATTLRDGRLHLEQLPSETSQPEGWRTDFTATVLTDDASFVAGLPFTMVDGEFDFDVHHVPGEPLRLAMDCRLDRATVMGQSLTKMTAPLRLNEAGDEAVISPIKADVERGAMSGQARFGIGANRRYSSTLELAGVPLGRFMDNPADEAADQTDHSMDGLVYASVSIAGERDDPGSRRGLAKIRVLDGSMARIPLVMQAVQLLQLTLPFSGDLDFADAEMYLVGDRVVFEKLLFESTVGNNAALQLFGEGEMNFDTLELNLRFRSRSGIAVIRDIVGGVSDRLFAIEVTGTLREPKSRIVPLPSGKP